MKEIYKRKIKNKTILITGGTGSFGHSVIKQLLTASPKKIIIFSRDEKKQFDMRNEFGDNRLLKFVIGDVRDRERVYSVMQGVDFVFHAAALKQVPTCEFFPLEAIKTNVLGAENVMNAAVKNNVKKVVVLSTDKAVYPINVVGMTKALMEKIMIGESKELNGDKSKTILTGVRYGNVLYTRGSVLPYFIELIKKGKPLTVTSPEMTRFLLPLPEAVDLVLYALTYGKSGFVYVRKSPSCTIETLATALCNIFKYKKGCVSLGLRAGEKMHETLVTVEEILRAKELKEYYAIPPESQGLDYNRYFYEGEKKKNKTGMPYTSATTKILNQKETENVLLSLPEIKEELKNWRI